MRYHGSSRAEHTNEAANDGPEFAIVSDLRPRSELPVDLHTEWAIKPLSSPLRLSNITTLGYDASTPLRPPYSVPCLLFHRMRRPHTFPSASFDYLQPDCLIHRIPSPLSHSDSPNGRTISSATPPGEGPPALLEPLHICGSKWICLETPPAPQPLSLLCTRLSLPHLMIPPTPHSLKASAPPLSA